MNAGACIDQMAARQHGIIGRSQALDCGLTSHQIRGRLESGEWWALDANVFALRSSAATWERKMQAAILSRAVALTAGRSAGYLHDFPGFRPGRPEILVPFEGNARSPLARVIRSRHFDRIETVKIAGFPCTSIAETVLTLSLRESAQTIERVVDDRLAAGALRIPDFDPILERLLVARQRGLPSLRRIVAERDSEAYQPPGNELERLLYQLLDRPELPDYDRQLPIVYPSSKATVDAYIPAWRMIIEGDGRRWHTRKADFERDRQRDNAAAAAGVLVIRLSYQMLHNDPDGCLQTLVDAGQFRATA
jgi:very-short-patch-repair endonuclease